MLREEELGPITQAAPKLFLANSTNKMSVSCHDMEIWKTEHLHKVSIKQTEVEAQVKRPCPAV